MGIQAPLQENETPEEMEARVAAAHEKLIPACEFILAQLKESTSPEGLEQSITRLDSIYNTEDQTIYEISEEELEIENKKFRITINSNIKGEVINIKYENITPAEEPTAIPQATTIKRMGASIKRAIHDTCPTTLIQAAISRLRK